MSDPIVYGFPRSTFVNIIRLILTHKDVAYTFHDLEPVMGKPDHLALHPFNRVPVLRHGDLTVYETSAIAAYVDEAFDGAAHDVAARFAYNVADEEEAHGDCSMMREELRRERR